MNNIHAKTVHNEYSTPHELHTITSARRVEEALKAPQRGPGPSLKALALTAFSLTKRRICKLYWSELFIQSVP